MKLHLISLGCTKNLVDSEVMLAKLSDYKMIDEVEDADLIILNTCGFIGKAKEESLNTIFEVHEKRKKDSLFVVSGCLSQRYQEDLVKEIPEVDIFTGVGDYEKIRELIDSRKSKFSDSVYLIDEEDRVITNSSYHAYIKLSEGCNQHCSFCAIPSFKGKLNSRSIASIVSEIKNLVSRGFFDFTLISQNSSSYLRDKGQNDGLIQLIDAIEDIDGVQSARILYLYPTTTTNELIEKIISSKVFHNYFDMPLQHISSTLLKYMRRGSPPTRIKELLSLMRQAQNSFIRTSFIVGHPGESEYDFAELIDFVEESGFDRINVFEYSDEEGTTAYTYEDKVPQEIINERIDILNNTIDTSYLEKLHNMKDQIFDVIIDGTSSEGEFFYGARALSWAPDIDGEILISESEIGDLQIGKIYKAKVSDIVGKQVLAKVFA